ncbi:MAG: nucleotide-binding protein [Bacteroidetes bacterium CG02_land_8_20_14_3_00_31_25]|nr:MAG: nucleotide-binding protein [Bacteroidetes bacterium CG02_land_8_20_14_3_00_31_25]
MKVIVDTNIIFSGLLNTSGTIGDLIFNSENVFDFYSCNYMRFEIEKHWDKLKQISKLSDKELKESLFRLFTKIHFINEEQIIEKIWLKAENLTTNIYIDDTDFVALTDYLKGVLWTGDKELYNGLINKGFKKVVCTQELLLIRTQQTKK